MLTPYQKADLVLGIIQNDLDELTNKDSGSWERGDSTCLSLTTHEKLNILNYLRSIESSVKLYHAMVVDLGLETPRKGEVP